MASPCLPAQPGTFFSLTILMGSAISSATTAITGDYLLFSSSLRDCLLAPNSPGTAFSSPEVWFLFPNPPGSFFSSPIHLGPASSYPTLLGLPSVLQFTWWLPLFNSPEADFTSPDYLGTTSLFLNSPCSAFSLTFLWLHSLLQLIWNCLLCLFRNCFLSSKAPEDYHLFSNSPRDCFLSSY